MNNESENETAPLLSRDSQAQTRAPPPEEQLPWYQFRRPWHIGLLVVLSATLWAFSTATSRLYVASGDLFGDTGFLRLNDVLHYVCRLLVAAPFGILADRARKPVYILASAGQILSIAWTLFVAVMQPMVPRELQLLGALGQLLGGGMLLVNVVHVTILADVLPADKRLLGFLFLALLQEPMIQVAVFVIGPLRALYSPSPLILSLVLALVGASLIVFLPETAWSSKKPQTGQVHEDWWSKSKSCFHLRFQDFGPALAVARSRSVLWVLLALTTSTLAANGYWLTVFAYVWSHNMFGSNWGPDLSLTSVVTHCLTLGLLLPALAVMLVHPNGHARFTDFQRDLVLARISAIFAMAGVLLTLCPAQSLLVVGTIAVGLSIGLHPLCLSLISFVTPASGYATIYTIILALSTLISTALAPFFYRAITPVGISGIFVIEGFTVALLYTVVLVALFQLRVWSAGPGNFVETHQEGVRGDGGSAPVRDELQV